METPMPKIAIPNSLNVEESRAKRLERQQARLRDRGGIFRPSENRTNILFDILCKANHRQSPQRARGRSRSASVSPRKKAQLIKTPNKLDEQKNTEYRTTPAKAKAIISEVRKIKRERSSRQQASTNPKSEKTKGKRKQKTNTVIEDDNPPKNSSRKPRAKKATTTTRKPRQASKGADKTEQTVPTKDTAIGDAKPMVKQQKTVQDSETPVPFPSPSPPKRSDKVKALPQLDLPGDLDVSGNQTEALKTSSVPAKAPSKKTKKKVVEPPSLNESTAVKSKTTNPEDTVNKRRSKKRSSDELEPDLLDENKQSRKKTKPSPGALRSLVTDPAHGGSPARHKYDNLYEDPLPTVAKQVPPSEGVEKPKKRARKQAETGDETRPSRAASKRLKTDAGGTHESKSLTEKTLSGSDNSIGVKKPSSKKTKPSRQDGREAKQRPRTASRKRKENNVPKIHLNESKGEKKSSGLPKQIKLRLKASMQHDDYDDGEPDPIDFLS